MANFSAGCVVYFRMLDAKNNLVCSPQPKARYLEIDSDSDFIRLKDEAHGFLGVFMKDFVSCILPLETVGPAADENSSN